jgi:hypothetical protein
MVSVMAFTSRAPRLQTSADRYYRFFDEDLARGFVAVRRRAVFSSQESASLKPSSL